MLGSSKWGNNNNLKVFFTWNQEKSKAFESTCKYFFI